MESKKIYICCATVLCLTFLSQQIMTQDQGAVALVPQSQVGKKQQEQLPQPLQTLLTFFDWVIKNPANVTDNELDTLINLIEQTSLLLVRQQMQNVFATKLVSIFSNRDQLSPKGKQIFSIIMQHKNQIKFISNKQLKYVIDVMVPALQPPPAPSVSSKQKTIPALARQGIAGVASTQPITASKNALFKRPKAAVDQQSLVIIQDYAQHIETISKKTKRSSVIISNLTQMLDKAGSQKVTHETRQKFTLLLNELSKSSNKFDQKLKDAFVALLNKTISSDFIAQNQKQFVQALHDSFLSAPKTSQPAEASQEKSQSIFSTSKG
jgi:hypothetical protein